MSKLQKSIICALSIVLVVLGIATMLVPKNESLATDSFIKPEFDSDSVIGPPNEVPNESKYQVAQLTPNFKIGMCGNLIVSKDDMVDLYLTSYQDNVGYICVILYDDDMELGRTGLVKPGQYVKSVKLKHKPKESKVISAKMLTYEEDTYYSLGSASFKLKLNV